MASLTAHSAACAAEDDPSIPTTTDVRLSVRFIVRSNHVDSDVKDVAVLTVLLVDGRRRCLQPPSHGSKGPYAADLALREPRGLNPLGEMTFGTCRVPRADGIVSG